MMDIHKDLGICAKPSTGWFDSPLKHLARIPGLQDALEPSKFVKEYLLFLNILEYRYYGINISSRS